jgi:hypothetical protein
MGEAPVWDLLDAANGLVGACVFNLKGRCHLLTRTENFKGKKLLDYGGVIRGEICASVLDRDG